MYGCAPASACGRPGRAIRYYVIVAAGQALQLQSHIRSYPSQIILCM